MTYNFLKKFLGPEQIEGALREVDNLKDVSDVDIAVAGGVAMQVYGSDRLTKDIDFLASRVFDGIDVQRRLTFGGVGGLTVVGRVPVDVIVRDDDSRKLYEEALETSVPSSDLLGARIVLPEYMAAIKLDAGRVKDEEDLHFLIRAEVIDLSTTRSIIRRLLGAFAVKEFQSHVDEMTWRMESERKKDSLK